MRPLAGLLPLIVAAPLSAQWAEELRPGARVSMDLRIDGGTAKVEKVSLDLDATPESVLEAHIESVQPDQGTVRLLGVLVTTSERTRFEGIDKEMISFADFRPGMRIMAEGNYADGRLIAERISVEEPDPDELDEAQIEAWLDGVDPAARRLEVLGASVQMTADSRIDVEWELVPTLLPADKSAREWTGAALVRSFDVLTSSGSFVPDPSALTFIPPSRTLVVSDCEIERLQEFAGQNLFAFALETGREARSASTMAFSKEPTGITYHPRRRTTFITDDDGKEVYETDESGEVVGRFDTESLGCPDPEGITADPSTGNLFIVSGGTRTVFEATATGEPVSRIPLARQGILDPESIAYDPRTGHFFLASSAQQAIFEFSRTGSLLTTYSLASLGIISPQGLAFAPSSEPSDPRGTMNLYVADAGIRDYADGKIVELALRSRPTDAVVYTHTVGDTDGFGFKGDEPGFAASDRDGDGRLEFAESLPDLDGRGAISLEEGRDAFDNRTDESEAMTDVSVLVTEAEPWELTHRFDLAGYTAGRARLTLLVADARTHPAQQSEVWVDGIMLGQIGGTTGGAALDGAISTTVLEFSNRALLALEDGELLVRITRPAGTESDDIAVDYSRLEILFY